MYAPKILTVLLSEKTLITIESEYQKNLQKETIDESLLVEIKDYLGNVRSALDYLWHKIPSLLLFRGKQHT